jgi:autotransporter-associated beta strand protein
LIWTSAVPANDLRIVTYNINADTENSNSTGVGYPGAGLQTVLQAIGNASLNGNAQPIDVLALQELSWVSSGVSPTLTTVVGYLNSIYGPGAYAYDPTYDPNDGNLTGNGPSGLIYNTKTIMDLGAVPIGTASGSGPPRDPMQYHLQPIGGASSSAFYLYVSHAKSGGDSGNNVSRRQQEAAEIVASAGTLGANANYIFTGDFNFGYSTDADYQTYVGSGNGPAYDPVSPSRNWSDNTASLLTEKATALDYRDDAQLVSGSILSGSGGLRLVAGTYTPFGNNGSTGIGLSVSQTSNTALRDLPNQSAVLQALTTATDHLPVVADYSFTSLSPATITVGSAVNWTIIAGGTAGLGASITNSATAGSNSLDYSLAAAVLSGSAALGAIVPTSGTLTPGATQPCTVSATSTNLGVNLVALTASDPNASNLSQTTTATLTVLGHAAPSLVVTAGNYQRVILGATGIVAGLRLANGAPGQTGLAALDVNGLGGGVNGAVGAALVTSGSAQTYTAAVSAGSSGTQTQTFSLNVGDDHTLSGAAPAGDISTGVTLTVVANRVVTASAASFGLVHVGAAVSQPIMLSTIGDDSHFTRVTVGNTEKDANGISVTGGANPVFNGSSVMDQRTLGGILNNVGAISGTITLTTSGEGLAGETPVNVSVNYTGQVYSGKAQWSTNSGAWSNNANWIDTVGGGPSGAPGISGYRSDTATFGPGSATGLTVVSLNSAAPVLSSLVIDSSAAGYAIVQGTGTTGLTLTGSDGSSPAAVTVLSGTHAILSPILLESNLEVTSSSSLTLAGDIGDGGMAKGLFLNGPSTMILSGTNSYSGGTYADSGTLLVNDISALPSGSLLSVGANADSIFTFSTFFSRQSTIISDPAGSPGVSPVPEPGSLLSFAVGAICCLAARRARSRILPVSA